MITRKGGNLFIRDHAATPASVMLEQVGFARLDQAFSQREVAALRTDVQRVFRQLPPDVRRPAEECVPWEEFRYEMLNRSARCQRVISDRRILDVVEPLVGEDCHVIANTAWRNMPQGDSRYGGGWHVDAGPHVPRAVNVPWDDRIPYPIFAIGAHIFLQDCPEECGPTAVIPASHKSGQAPPFERRYDTHLSCNGQQPVVITARTGDVVLFVSDAWHRRMPPSQGDTGRFFLQVHYGRRDLAQRLRTTAQANQLSPAARKRAKSPRARSVIGLHPPFFYDG